MNDLQTKKWLAAPPRYSQANTVEDFRPQPRVVKNRIADACHRAARDPATVRLLPVSMGMSSDFEIAIEEGATVVRVGQAIYGARPFTRQPFLARCFCPELNGNLNASLNCRPAFSGPSVVDIHDQAACPLKSCIPPTRSRLESRYGTSKR